MLFESFQARQQKKVKKKNHLEHTLPTFANQLMGGLLKQDQYLGRFFQYQLTCFPPPPDSPPSLFFLYWIFFFQFTLSSSTQSHSITKVESVEATII